MHKKSLNFEMQITIQDFEEDVKECVEVITEQSQKYIQVMQKKYDHSNRMVREADEVLKLRTLIEWIAMDSGKCFKRTEA